MDPSSLPSETVRAALDKIAASLALGGASRSRDLLRYLVEALLSGRSDQLKEYTVGAEALGRGDRFDPRVDSIARAEASRLRNRLTLYYATEGRDDAVIISLPAGGYVPSISQRTLPGPGPLLKSLLSSRIRSTLLTGSLAVGGGFVVALAFGLFTLLAPRPRGQRPPAPLRVDIALGTPGEIFHAASTSLAISRDGKVMVMQVRKPGGGSRLFSRRMDSLIATELPGTGAPFSPILSPDGRWVAFTSGGELKKTLVDGGGSPITLAPASTSFTGSWGDDRQIINTNDTGSSLWRVPEEGGKPTLLFDLGAGKGQLRWPFSLPSGKGILFTVTNTSGRGSIDYVRLDGTGHKSLSLFGISPRYLPSGHIVYADGPQLFAVRFDLDRMETRGAPWLVLEDVAFLETFSSVSFDIADDGTLVYIRSKSGGLSTIQRVDATGNTRMLVGEPKRRFFPRLSPDGRTLVYVQADGAATELWTCDMQSGRLTRLATGPGDATSPAWTPDGKHILYQQDGKRLAAINADGSGSPQALLEIPGMFWSPSPDGRTLAFQYNAPGHHLDLWTAPLKIADDDISVGKPTNIYGTPATETEPAYSPDGQWMSYASAQSGSGQLYVRPTSGSSQPVVVSTDTGRLAQWSNDRKTLFYETMDLRIMSVRYRSEGGIFKSDLPVEWFARDLANMSVLPNYALAADGSFVVAMMPVGDQSRDHVTVIRNFFDMLNAH